MKIILCMSIVVVLCVSCSTKKSRFACKPGRGLGCVSVPEVYNRLYTGRLKLKKASPETDVPRIVRTSSAGTSETSLLSRSFRGPEYRKPKILRIWLEPWVDEKGVYHAQSYLYKVVEKGRWVPAGAVELRHGVVQLEAKKDLYSDLDPDAEPGFEIRRTGN